MNRITTRRLVSWWSAAALSLGFTRNAPAQDTSIYAQSAMTRTQAVRARGLWTPATTPVLLSFSGGISLGAYQAGVNWVMVEAIKGTHYKAGDPRFTNLFPNAGLPDISVIGMTGASAGNINVLLASIEYCDSTLTRPPNQSLFWEMWVKSGWDELFPEDGERPDPGALDRSRSFKRLRDAVDAASRSRPFKHGCHVNIGVVATRVRPVTEALDRNVTYQSQRFAALFDATVSDKRLQFVRPEVPLLRAGNLGSQLVLPVGAGNIISLDAVFDVVKASSSYPIAFAPVPITYETPGCVLGGGCSKPSTAKFLDGGVFDNNPIGLAVGMRDVLVAAARKDAARLQRLDSTKTRVLYVDPGAARDNSPLHRRQVELAIRAEAGESDAANGIGALLNFAGGFVPTSRNYELQSFARSQLALDSTKQTTIRSSTRARAVIGEHLNAFAAFLGEPFREMDFYIGVADGMQFVASEILCSARRPWALDATLEERIKWNDANPASPIFNPTLAQRAVEECTGAQLNVLAHYAFNIDGVGRRFVQHALSREYSGIPVDTPPQNLPATEKAREEVLAALERATYNKLLQPLQAETGCSNGAFLTRAICGDGFNVVLDSIRNESNAMKILACSDPYMSAWDHLTARPNDVECESFGRYPVGIEQTRQLIVRPKATLDKYLTKALVATRHTEQDEETHNRPDDWSIKLKLAELVYRAADDNEGVTLDLGPSSIPRYDGWRSTVFAALPYFVGPNLGTRGFQVGWQPTLHTPWKRLTALLPLGLDIAPRPVEQSGGLQWALFASPGVGKEFKSALINQLAVGWRLQTLGSLNHDFELGGAIATEFSGYFLGRRIRLNAYRSRAVYTTGSVDRWVGGVSLADVNGLVYWLAR